MVSTNSLVSKLNSDFPDITFTEGETALWSAPTHTVQFINSNKDEDVYELLHEVGHGALNHATYGQDIELMAMERSAWDKAMEISQTYELNIPDEIIELHLDSYREWLYARSRCPQCAQAGVQEKKSGNYRCLLCHTIWKSNEAKHCGLKRYLAQTKTSA